MIADAAARIAMAYALPVDLVPALSAGLSALTIIVLALIDQINYARTGFRQVLLGRRRRSEVKTQPLSRRPANSTASR